MAFELSAKVMVVFLVDEVDVVSEELIVDVGIPSIGIVDESEATHALVVKVKSSPCWVLPGFILYVFNDYILLALGFKKSKLLRFDKLSWAYKRRNNESHTYKSLLIYKIKPNPTKIISSNLFFNELYWL